MMKHTSMYNNGYRYYVYLGPGNINYFTTYREALIFAEDNGGDIKEVY
jgi:hypothetical protein